MKLIGKLNQKRIDAILNTPVDARKGHPDGRGLSLIVALGRDGEMHGSWVLSARSLSGKPLRVGLGSISTVTLAEARAKADEARKEIAEGRNPAQEKRTARVEAQKQDASTLGIFIRDTYGPHLIDTNHKSADSAKARILADWKTLLEVPIANVSSQAICDVLRKRKACKDADGKPLLAPATLRRSWATFRPALVYARDIAHLIERLPIEGTPEPLRGLREEPPKRYLGKYDVAETTRFLAALAKFESAEPGGGEFARVTCALALNAGLRRGEITLLTDTMFSMATPGQEMVSLPAAICKGGRAREVPLNQPAVEAVKKWQAVRKAMKVESIDGRLFPGDSELWGRRLTAREFPRLLAEAGIVNDGADADKVTFKTLRATFASLHVQAGVPLQQVQQWLGHSSVLVTERHYGFLRPTTGQEAARAFRVS